MENQLFQYNPTSEGNTENDHKVTLRNDMMSVLGYQDTILFLFEANNFCEMYFVLHWFKGDNK